MMGHPAIVENVDNGEVTFTDVLPGSYRLAFNCFIGYVTSAHLGGTDLLANPVLTIAPGVAPPTIEVAARFGGGTLSVTLKGGDAAKDAQTGILLVPQFASAMGPVAMGGANAQNDQPDAPGSAVYEFRNLAPGTYAAYALAKLSDVEFRNPEFVSGLTGGTSVEIADGKQAQLTLTSVVR